MIRRAASETRLGHLPIPKFNLYLVTDDSKAQQCREE
jgi:hypothetical protein